MHAMRIPSTRLTQSPGDAARGREGREPFPQVAFVFSKTGTAEVATDPMPPTSSDTFIILKPQDEWPDPSLPKDDADRANPGGGRRGSRQQLRVHAADPDALQRADRGRPRRRRREGFRRRVRHDAARPPTRSPRSCAASPGAADVKVEQVEGLPFLRSRSTRPRSRGYGLSVVRRAGRDRRRRRRAGGRRRLRGRPPLRHRRASAGRGARRPGGTREPAGAAAAAAPNASAAARRVPLKQRRRARLESSREGPNQISRENGKRRIVVRPTCAAATSARSWPRRSADRGRGEAAGGLLARLGRPVREPRSPPASA